MSIRTDVLLWAQRIVARTGAQPHELLEVKKDGTVDEAQAAFHKLARKYHPDLHRASLTPEELEQVTLAYAKVAGAYQDFRSQRMATRSMKPMGRIPTPREVEKITAGGPTTEMSSKALVYYRKAELALRRGDLQGAVLQLKMAIAADPQSPLLRKALAEVQAELGKNP